MGILILLLVIMLIVPEIFLIPFLFFIVLCETILRLFGKSLDDDDRGKTR
jgi:hypothetical protein